MTRDTAERSLSRLALHLSSDSCGRGRGSAPAAGATAQMKLVAPTITPRIARLIDHLYFEECVEVPALARRLRRDPVLISLVVDALKYGYAGPAGGLDPVIAAAFDGLLARWDMPTHGAYEAARRTLCPRSALPGRAPSPETLGDAESLAGQGNSDLGAQTND